LSDANNEQNLAVRTHWQIPAAKYDKSLDDAKNKIRSRITLNQDTHPGGLYLHLHIIDETKATEEYSFKTPINPSRDPLTIANWQDRWNGRTAKRMVLVEYPGP
jgi:hypothetical protein